MKYRIIWIDDSPKWVLSVKEELIEIFESKNFALEVENYEKVELANGAVENNFVDLVLIDCNLPDISGDEFIKQLRSNRCFAHVVFYSNDKDNLQKLTEDKQFIHVTHRDDISDTLEHVAEQAYRKYHHPAFRRGLLLSEFVDLENLMEDLIVQCFKTEGEYFRASIINKGGENYSLAAKFKFIRRLINEAKEINVSLESTFKEINITSTKFKDDITDRRNILAHARLQYDETSGNVVLISSFPNVDFNEDWFCETRNYIYDFKNKIRSLIKLELFKIVNP